MDSSSFSEHQVSFDNAMKLNVSGATCECYRVRYYSKLHFLKRLKPEMSGDPRYRSLLSKEFEIGFSLDHPNLVRYVNKGDDFILMDYVDGDTLTKFISRQPYYFQHKANRRKFADQLLSVVSYLHSHQIVHLDIKPDNIMITRIGHDLKLIDLGFSYNDTFPDTTGHTKGFAAPEQLLNPPQVDERTDIYAIGKVLAMIPYGKEFRRIINRCTLAQPVERFQTVEGIRDELEKKRWQPAAIAAAVLTAAVISFILFLPKNHPEENETTAILSASDSLTKTPKDHTSAKDSLAQQEQNEEITIQATPQTASNPVAEETPPTPAPQPVTTEPVTPAPQKAEETVKPRPATPEPAQPIASQQPKANPQKQQTDSRDVSAPEPVYANVEEKVIQEFKREIRPLVIRMEDEHIANGGFTEMDGKRFIWINDNYVKLRNSYTSKHFNPIKNKLMNKYKRQLTDFEKYDLPQQFETAISEVSNDYLRSIGYK